MLKLAESIRKRLLGMPRRYKRALQVTVDTFLVWIALWLAFVVRLGEFDAVRPFNGHGWLFVIAPLIALPLFIRFGMYRAVMRYLGNDALVAIAKAVSLSALLLAKLAVSSRREAALEAQRRGLAPVS